MKTQLKEVDKQKMRVLNAQCEWGLTYDELVKVTKEYKEAKENNNAYKCALIEYRLTDINYLKEVLLLQVGNYDEIINDVY